MTKTSPNTVLDAFRKNVESHPDHVALVYENLQLSYRQADQLSDALAVYLEAHVPAGSVVGIMLGRNEHMMTAPLGALKAGCAYLPLDPSYPPERLLFMMQDANAQILIADKDLLPILKELSPTPSSCPFRAASSSHLAVLSLYIGGNNC